jgi:hypothetical protein
VATVVSDTAAVYNQIAGRGRGSCNVCRRGRRSIVNSRRRRCVSSSCPRGQRRGVPGHRVNSFPTRCSRTSSHLVVDGRRSLPMWWLGHGAAVTQLIAAIRRVRRLVPGATADRTARGRVDATSRDDRRHPMGSWLLSDLCRAGTFRSRLRVASRHAKRPLGWVEERPPHPCLVTDVGVSRYSRRAWTILRGPLTAQGSAVAVRRGDAEPGRDLLPVRPEHVPESAVLVDGLPHDDAG